MSDNAVAEWRNRVSSATNMLVQAAGSVTAIVLALIFVVGYLWWGAVHGFTRSWFAILYSVTGIVAFVMVFLIRHAEGRESRAAHVKLDELIAATTGASNALVGLEQAELDKQEELEAEAPVGEGSAPGTGGSGGGEPALAEAPDDPIPVIETLHDVAALVEKYPALYVRHSEGPEDDARKGVSRDYESGVDLPGLSVSTIVPEQWWPGPAEDWIARRICKYDRLTEDDPDRFPWLLTGEHVGWGPDHEPVVRMTKAVAIISRRALDEARRRYNDAFAVGQDSTS